jgi:hypothetical protein
MISRSDWEPLPTRPPSVSPFARGYLSLCRFFTAAVWCVPALRVRLVHSLINHFRQKEKEEKKRGVCATRAVRVATMGRGVASTMQPAAQMPVPPPRAQGEDGVASLWRTLGRAAPTALDGPFAERVLTARRERSGGCRPVGAQ